MAWAIRFRFSVGKGITSDAATLEIPLGGHVGVLKPIGGGFTSARVLDLRVHDIATEHEAHNLAEKLKLAILVHGARNRFGIDAGEDRATSGFGTPIANAFAENGYTAMPDVHGLTVYESQGNEQFLNLNISASVHLHPSQFVESLQREFADGRPIGPREQTALELINLAEVSREQLARATLAFAAVEWLSQSPPWTAGQAVLLSQLKEVTAAETSLSAAETAEVVTALDGLFRYSVRRQIKRMMTAIGLGHRWTEFSRLYTLRSNVFHGTNVSRDAHSELATWSLILCSEVVLAAVDASRSAGGDGSNLMGIMLGP